MLELCQKIRGHCFRNREHYKGERGQGYRVTSLSRQYDWIPTQPL